jgi:hypothetical protein
MLTPRSAIEMVLVAVLVVIGEVSEVSEIPSCSHTLPTPLILTVVDGEGWAREG